MMALNEYSYFIGIIIGISVILYKLYSSINKLLLNKKVYINGISSCFPPNCYNQNQMRDMFIKNYCLGEENIKEEDLDFINRVFSATLIEKCYVNLSENDLYKQMTREEYTKYAKETILMMSCKAAENVIRQCSGLNKEHITHIVFGTMTSTIAAPSIDILISKALNLSRNIKRLNVEAMGCLTGFRLVGLCRDIASQSENNIILLIVCDIRSALGNQLTHFTSKQSIDKSNVIISALFRDACGAAIISQKKNLNHVLNIIDHQSFIIENTLDLGRLREYDGGKIHLYLDKNLPCAVFEHAPIIVNDILSKNNISIDSCQVAVHAGGPRIIRGIKQCLNLKDEQLCASWFVMINYGNLSGTSNLVVVDHFIKWYSGVKPSNDNQTYIHFPKDFRQYKYVIGLSFGPGIAVDCILFKLE